MIDDPHVFCVRAKLHENILDEVRQWMSALHAREDEVLETFRAEGVWIESVFFEKLEDADYLIYYMRADDVQKAVEVFQQSVHPVDQFHKECWNKYVKESSVLEAAFDLQRKQGIAVKMKPEEIFVDVIALSKKRCQFPISGSLAYATSENFLGRVVDGYKTTNVCLLSRKAAEQLCYVQNKLNEKGLRLVAAT